MNDKMQQFVSWLRDNHDAIQATAAAGKLATAMSPEQFMQAVEAHAALMQAGQ